MKYGISEGIFGDLLHPLQLKLFVTIFQMHMWLLQISVGKSILDFFLPEHFWVSLIVLLIVLLYMIMGNLNFFHISF